MNEAKLNKKDVDLIKNILSGFPQISEASFFGSRAMGTAKKESDIDIALKGKIDLDILAKVQYSLNEDLPLPYFFDVVDYESIQNKKLKSHIDEYGKLFYDSSTPSPQNPELSS